ncbi:hypothetical protein JCM3775_004899 [Rhodotorula graminis]|uniref:DUF1682-domain-containing protein n=1 Tax=Rhodotorula graminis (strain WP1) TaxID=578459 RepID=A0A0N8PZ96_RHOGW|nr:uncharacterized protein RHOBADRAFT_47666 [Rhodotorula graminis WP1]KPV71709.1 hypothetical protein RHOBADRAFT_47666 [Rhodotorula graminis WP1]
MARSSVFVPGTAAACVLGATSAHAAWGKQNPSPVDAADPAPAAPPHPEVAPLFPEVVPAVAGATPLSATPPTAVPTLPPRLGVEHSLGPFRVRPAELRLEAAMLAVLALYGLSTLAIRRSNSSRASAWFRAHEEVLRAEFAGVGLGGDKLFASDGGDEFSSYASGRRAVEYMWAKVKTGGQDVLARLYDLARGVYDYSYDSGKDKVTLDFKLALPKGTPGAKFCFAAVRREVLRQVRDSRWDLRTFTNVSETAGVSPSLIVMTESGDVTNALLKDTDTGLLDALREGAPGLEYLESIIVSDMPAETPDDENPSLPDNDFRLVVTLRLPPSSQAAATKDWVTLACNIADVLYTKQKLVPEVAIGKLKKRRADALYSLQKAQRDEAAALAREAKEDAAALKRKLDREAAEAKLAKMTPAERVAHKQREAEKERKKLMQKQVKRAR